MNTILPSFENITELNEHLTPFPNIDNIFVEHQSWLKEHFLPLISIDLGILKDEWRGQVVHMINPFEPVEGYIGESTHDFHNEFTGENWLAFKLTQNNQYEFLGNEQYFAKSPKNKMEELFDKNIYGEHFYQYFDDYIIQSKKNYQLAQEYFTKTNKLVNIHASNDDTVYQEHWFDCVGGRFEDNELSNYHKNLPTAFLGQENDDDELLSICYNNNPFYFIAGVPAYNYGCSGADWIVMLYEPISHIVLFTFDYS